VGSLGPKSAGIEGTGSKLKLELLRTTDACASAIQELANGKRIEYLIFKFRTIWLYPLSMISSANYDLELVYITPHMLK